MRIGKPVAKVPSRSMDADVWAAVAMLEDGEALPLEFDSVEEARAWRKSRNSAAFYRGLVQRLRDNVIYIRPK